MWILFALIAGIAAGIAPLLGSRAAKAIGAASASLSRAAIVWIGSVFFVLLTRVPAGVPDLLPPISSLFSTSSLPFALAGIADGLAWLCYYRSQLAIGIGDTAIGEKISVPLTLIGQSLLAATLPSFSGVLTSIGVLLSVGFYLLLSCRTRRSSSVETRKNPQSACICGDGKLSPNLFRRFLPVVASSIFSASQILLSKIGLNHSIDRYLGFSIRSATAFGTLGLVALFCRGSTKNRATAVTRSTPIHPTSILIASLAAGILALAGWLFCYRALASGPASGVQSLMKLNFWIPIGYATLQEGSSSRIRLLLLAILSLGLIGSCFT